MNIAQSEALFARAQRYIPGGVNSPVRAFRAVGGTPRFFLRGEGSRIYDVDGNEYIDYVCSWGPLLFGHRPKPVIDALGPMSKQKRPPRADIIDVLVSVHVINA